MERVFTRIIAFLAGLAAFSCTSIKEDRSRCPAEYTVVFSGPEQTEGEEYSFSASGAGLRDGFVYRGGEQARVYSLPRKPLSLFAYCGWTAESPYVVRLGDSCDSVYTGRADAFCKGESGWNRLVLHKDFATLFIAQELASGAGPWTVRIEVDCCGIDPSDGRPVRGAFRCMPQMSTAGTLGTAAIRIPRQTDGFRLCFLRSGNVMPVKTLAFDAAAAAAIGYSWTSEDLEDISITAEITAGSVTAEVSMWNDGGGSSIHL